MTQPASDQRQFAAVSPLDGLADHPEAAREFARGLSDGPRRRIVAP